MGHTDLRSSLDVFGEDSPRMTRVLDECMARGADFADLFLQRIAASSMALEDGVVSWAHSGTDRGVGVRAVVGDQTGYAFTESLEIDSMFAVSPDVVPPQPLHWAETPRHYDVEYFNLGRGCPRGVYSPSASRRGQGT